MHTDTRIWSGATRFGASPATRRAEGARRSCTRRHLGARLALPAMVSLALIGLACTPVPAGPMGNFEGVTQNMALRSTTHGAMVATGWAINPNNRYEKADGKTDVELVLIRVDGGDPFIGFAQHIRHDVAAAHPEYGPHRGFTIYFDLPAGAPHQVCASMAGGETGPEIPLGCMPVTAVALGTSPCDTKPRIVTYC